MNKSSAQTSASGRTRVQIMEAALEALKTVGFAGATSRTIARLGGFNQALIFYHFGSVEGLLLAALDRTSEERLAAYRGLVEQADSPAELLAAAAEMYRADLRSGHMTVISQLVAGSLTREDLAPQVLARMEPWIDFAEEAIARAVAATPLEGLAPARQLAHAAITFYLGVNLLSHLDPEHRITDGLFEQAAALAPLLGVLDQPPG
jgi:AcrR family transcriptional regulator